MSSALVDSYRNNAEIFHGEALCKQKFHDLLEELCLPKGVIRADIEEMGHHRPSGFVWVKQKQKMEHKFKKIGKTVAYGAEVTMVVEKGRIKQITGCACKQLFLWVTVCEMYLKDVSSDKLCFKTPSGLTGTFPASAFEDDEDDGDRKNHH